MLGRTDLLRLPLSCALQQTSVVQNSVGFLGAPNNGTPYAHTIPIPPPIPFLGVHGISGITLEECADCGHAVSTWATLDLDLNLGHLRFRPTVSHVCRIFFRVTL